MVTFDYISVGNQRPGSFLLGVCAVAGRASFTELGIDWCVFSFYNYAISLETLICSKGVQKSFLSLSGHSFVRKPKSVTQSSCGAAVGLTQR